MMEFEWHFALYLYTVDWWFLLKFEMIQPEIINQMYQVRFLQTALQILAGEVS